jgi:hypothetical protein
LFSARYRKRCQAAAEENRAYQKEHSCGRQPVPGWSAGKFAMTQPVAIVSLLFQTIFMLGVAARLYAKSLSKFN